MPMTPKAERFWEPDYRMPDEPGPEAQREALEIAERNHWDNQPSLLDYYNLARPPVDDEPPTQE